jgi:glycine cleavage system regulatory protein
LTVIVQKDSAPLPSPPFAALRLDVVGNDRAGIVHEVTRVLAERQVNVEEFQTECVRAPMSGGRLFRATARLRLPAHLTAQQLQAALEQIAHDLMVELKAE